MSQPGEIFNFKGGCCSCSFLFFMLGAIYIIATFMTATMPMKVGSEVYINDVSGIVYNNMAWSYYGTVTAINGDNVTVHFTEWSTFSTIERSRCNLVRTLPQSELTYDEEATIKDYGKTNYYVWGTIFIVIAIIVMFAIMGAINKAGSSTVNYVSGGGNNSQGGFTPK